MVRAAAPPLSRTTRQAKQAQKPPKPPARGNSKIPPKAKPIAKPKAKPAKVVKIAPKPQKKATPAPVKAKPTKSAPVKAAAPRAAKAPIAPKAAKVSSGPAGYTPAEYVKFKELKGKFEEYSNQKLKDLLRANSQSMSGNKDDLVYKCADGATLGRIPRCPKCFGGRPKFDFKKGTYYCSGYRDDEDFKNCHSTFQLSEITRDAWTDN